MHDKKPTGPRGAGQPVQQTDSDPLTLERMIEWIELLDAALKRAPDDNYRMIQSFYVLMYLFDVYGKKDTARLFEKYYLWISDLHEGITHPELRPGRGSGGISSDIWCSRAMVAVAVEAKIRQLGEGDGAAAAVKAATWVLSHCSIEHLKVRRAREGGTSTTLIRSWHAEFAKKRIKNAAAGLHYDRYMQILETVPAGSEEQFAARLLKLMVERGA
jgi:hypothetical protein